MASFLHQQRATRRRARDSPIEWGWAFDRTTERLTRWALGTGFLQLHAYLFFATVIGVTLWRMVLRPDDVRVDGIFIVWGALVLLHAGLVLILTIGMRLMGDNGRTTSTGLPARPWIGLTAPDQHPSDPSDRSPQPEVTWVTQTESVVGTAGRRAGQATAQALTDLGVLLAEGTTFVARATRRKVTHLSRSGQSGSSSDNGWPQTARHGATSPYDAWAAAQQAFSLNGAEAPPSSHDSHQTAQHGADAVHAGGPANGSVTWSSMTREERVDQVISVTPGPPASSNGHEPNEVDPTRRWIDNYLDDQEGERDARWTWIEAAASSWLARGELIGEPNPALPPPSEGQAADDEQRTASPQQPITSHGTHSNGNGAHSNGQSGTHQDYSANGMVTAANGNGRHDGHHNGNGHHGPHGA